MNYKKFEKILIDKEEVQQSELNIEVKNKSNIFTWNGQFSPQFVDTMLQKYAVENAKIIDPFVGSGTSILGASLLNLDICGVELNPSAYYLAKIYTLCNLSIVKRKEVLDKIEDEFLKEKSFIQIPDEDENIKNILTVLLMLNKENKETLINDWERLKKIILDLPCSQNHIQVINCDSRKVKLRDNYYDLLFTSPPYINVYNYHQQYRTEMEKIGYSVLDIAVSEIGSNRKNRGNRFVSVVQYCIDITMLLNNLLVAMKDSSRLIFVIGRSSKVLGVSFSNSELLYEIMVRIFRCKLIMRQERYFKNKYGKIIYEDILHFKCNKENLNKTNTYYLGYSRKIAKQYIQKILDELGADHLRYLLLKDVYDNIDTIYASK